MELAWEFRFFDRELLALLRADPQLLARYRQVHERRMGQWLAFGEQLVAQRAVAPPPATIADLATAAWLIGTAWLPFLEITGVPCDSQQLAKGADLVLAVLNPCLPGRDGRRRGAVTESVHDPRTGRAAARMD